MFVYTHDRREYLGQLAGTPLIGNTLYVSYARRDGTVKFRFALDVLVFPNRLKDI